MRPPFPPMEALAVEQIPAGPGWLYEPKWDGFRCLAFKSGGQVLLQSKSGQPLGRYFPELLEALRRLPARRFVLDGEVVVFLKGRTSFDDLLQRIHPAQSRIRKLSSSTPATVVLFDLLVDAGGRSLLDRPLVERRARLETFAAELPPGGRILLSPSSPRPEVARRWLRRLGAVGLDGVVAKLSDARYDSGGRDAMRKIKRLRTAECVVGGLRRGADGEVASLLLGLYGADGLLHHVGFAASFSEEERRALRPVVDPRVGPPGFTGKAPGGPSRWSSKRSTEWEPLRPELVCEVRYDHFTGDRFRHGTKFLRWRPDKAPKACTFRQVRPSGSPAALRAFLRGRRIGA